MIDLSYFSLLPNSIIHIEFISPISHLVELGNLHIVINHSGRSFLLNLLSDLLSWIFLLFWCLLALCLAWIAWWLLWCEFAHFLLHFLGEVVGLLYGVFGLFLERIRHSFVDFVRFLLLELSDRRLLDLLGLFLRVFLDHIRERKPIRSWVGVKSVFSLLLLLSRLEVFFQLLIGFFDILFWLFSGLLNDFFDQSCFVLFEFFNCLLFFCLLLLFFLSVSKLLLLLLFFLHLFLLLGFLV